MQQQLFSKKWLNTYIPLGKILLLFGVSLLFFSSCSRDICSDLDCNNQGIKTWTDGNCDCECLPGFVGAFCDSSIFSQLAGFYFTSDICFPDDITEWTILNLTDKTLTINNWPAVVCGSDKRFIAAVHFDSLRIDTQVFCAGGQLFIDPTITGLGTVNYDGTAEISYTIWYTQADTTVVENCTATLSQ